MTKWLPSAILAALLAGAGSSARSEVAASPFGPAPAPRVAAVSAIHVADPVGTPAHTILVSGGAAASSPAADEFYVDWVSPLQAPRGPSAGDLLAPGNAFSEMDPLEAFSGPSEDNAPPLAIPEPGTVALLGAALIPLANRLRRR